MHLPCLASRHCGRQTITVSHFTRRLLDTYLWSNCGLLVSSVFCVMYQCSCPSGSCGHHWMNASLSDASTGFLNMKLNVTPIIQPCLTWQNLTWQSHLDVIIYYCCHCSLANFHSFLGGNPEILIALHDNITCKIVLMD